VTAVVTCAVLAAGVVVGIDVTRSPRSEAPFGLAAPYPPGRLADSQFVALPAGAVGTVRMSVAGVASAGSTLVAVGWQPGLPAARPVILVSADGGHNWRRATLPPAPPPAGGPQGAGSSAPRGAASPGAPPLGPGPFGPGSADTGLADTGLADPGLAGIGLAGPGLPGSATAAPGLASLGSEPATAPVLAAGGAGRWLALGAQAGWVSSDGVTWRAVPGLPGTARGDQVTGLARTGGGFLAVGQHLQQVAGHPVTSPVVWTTPDGVTWHRAAGSGLTLAAGGGQVLSLRSVAAHGRFALITGDVASTRVARRGGHRVHVRVDTPGLWRTMDGGTTWHPVPVPSGRGAVGGIAGIAATANGFVLVRPGLNLHQRRDAVIFTSPLGAFWTAETRLIAGGRAALRAIAVAGSEHGVAVTGVVHGHRQAFVSGTGASWTRTSDLGAALGRPVTALTVGPGRTLVAAGMDARRTSLPANPRPFLLLARFRTRLAGEAVLTGTGAADVVVNDLATGAGQQGAGQQSAGQPNAGQEIAVGSADGAPAVWQGSPPQGTGGGWTRLPIAMPASWNGGGAGLTSAAAGPAGWFAVGSTTDFGRPPAPAAPTAATPGPVGQPAGQPLAVTSADGSHWQAAPNAGPLLAPGVTLAQIAAGPAGYVVVGGQVRGGQQAAAAWHSAHLAGWGQATGAGRGDLDVAAPSQMLAVTATGTGFVAAGYAGRSPAVWTSAEGSRWRLATLPVPAGATAAALTQVTARDGRVIATGTAATPTGPKAFAAASGNGGRGWRVMQLPVPAQPGTGHALRPPTQVTALTTVPGGFLAAGVAATPAGRSVLIWSSPTGLVWHATAPAAAKLTGPGDREITALTGSGRSLTAAGYVITRSGQHPLLWQPHLQAPAASGG
jgi:hypothetical protein